MGRNGKEPPHPLYEKENGKKNGTKKEKKNPKDNQNAFVCTLVAAAFPFKG